MKLPFFLFHSFGVALVASLLLPTSLSAQTTYTWQGNSALWQTPGEWSPGGGPPVAGDTARPFGDNVTISFNANAAAQLLEVRNASLSQTTLDLDGNTLTLGGSSGQALTIESNAPRPNQRLTITNGTVSLEREMRLQFGAVEDINSQLILTGSSTVFNTQNRTSNVGFFGRAEVIVENGAVWNNKQVTPSSTDRPDLRFGTSTSATERDGEGLLRVTGSGSTFDSSTAPATAVDAQPRIGFGQEQSAQGALEVLAGGTFLADVVEFSRAADTIGTALISGGDSSYTTRRTYLGARVDSTDVGGSATMTVENSATASTELLRVAARDSDTFGKLALDRGTMSVTGANGALFDPDSHLEFTLHDSADLAALVVTQGLTITNSVLGINLAPTFSAVANDVFTLASYGTLTGTFAGLSQNSTFAVGDYIFQIDYGSGTASSIQLTFLNVIPEPSSALLFGVGLAVLALRKRRTKSDF